MIKKYLPILIALAIVATPVFAALIPFISEQVGSSPSSGFVLQTNGTKSTWVSTASLGISGGSGTGWASTTDALSIYFTGTNNVGIGSTTPYSKLSVTKPLGSELVTNGTFTGSATGWTLGTGWAYGSNKVTHTAGNTADFHQSVPITAGKRYILSFTVSGWTTGKFTYILGNDGDGIETQTGNTPTDGNYAFELTPADTSDLIIQPIQAGGTTELTGSFDGSFDNVSVKEVPSTPITSIINSDLLTGLVVNGNGHIGIGTGGASPTAILQIGAGTFDNHLTPLQISTLNDYPYGLLIENLTFGSSGFGFLQGNDGNGNISVQNGTPFIITPTIISFSYSSSTAYSSFASASTTSLIAGNVTLSTTTLGCLQIGAGGRLYSTGSGCGSSSGLSSYDAWTHSAAGFSATTSNLQLNGQASTTQFSVYNKAYFGASATTTIDSSGNVALSAAGTLKIPAITSKNLNIDSTGLVYGTGTSTPTVTAPITYSGTLGQFISGVSGAFDCTSASSGVKGCITASDYSKFGSATTTFSAPLVYTLGTNAVTCTSATGAVTGCLTASDWNTFNNKVGTSTVPTLGQLAMWTNIGTPSLLGSVATTSLTVSGFPASIPSTLGALVGGSNTTWTWWGLSTTSQPSASNLLTSDGGKGVYGTATSTLSASAPLTGSFVQVGSGGSLGCTTASITVAGCISAASFYDHNNKVATSGNETMGQLAAWGTTSGTPPKLFSVATTSIGADGTSLTFSGTAGAQVGGAAGTYGINLGNTNTWTVLQNFNYSSSTLYSSFKVASTTNLNVGTATFATTTVGCAQIGTGGVIYSTGTVCGTSSGLTAYDAWTPHSTVGLSATTSALAISTTTNQSLYPINAFSATLPQLMLSAGAGVAQWGFRNAGGNFYLSSTTVAGNATTSIPVLGVVNDQLVIQDGTCSKPAIAFLDDSNNGLASPANDIFTICTNGLERFRVHDGTGASGFGTTTFSQAILTLGTSTAPQLVLSDNTNADVQWAIRNAGGNLYLATTTAAGSATTSTAAFSLIATGKPSMGISTDTPSAQLAVQAINTTDFPNLFIIASSTGLAAATNVTILRVDNNGKAFLPKLSVNASAHTYTMCGEATTFEAVWDTTTCVLSAAKYKTNIDDLDIGLAELMKVRPVVFNWKPTGDAQYDNDININHQQIGVIADEIAKIDKRLVTYSSDGEINGFRYDFYTAWLTKSIQELAMEKDMVRSMEENWQDILIGLLILGFIHQQLQIRKLKK